MTRTPRRHRAETGMVLVLVLFFVLLLAAAMASFLRRVAIDAAVAANLDRSHEAEALARGGIRLGETLLLEDLRVRGTSSEPDSLEAVWARVTGVDLIDDPDVELQLKIEDAAARINLNGFLESGAVDEDGRLFLQALFEGVIAIMPGDPAEHRYDPADLAAALVDWIDTDEVGVDGEPESARYARREPPVVPANRPLLSVDELRQIEGFDEPLVDALRPFVGVYPLVGGGGLNLNTAPPWILRQMLRGNEVSGLRPVQDDDVRRIVDLRKKGPLCTAQEAEHCIPLTTAFGTDQIQPPLTDRSAVFTVTATARVFDVERRIRAVIDRSDPAELARLSWSVE